MDKYFFFLLVGKKRQIKLNIQRKDTYEIQCYK